MIYKYIQVYPGCEDSRCLHARTSKEGARGWSFGSGVRDSAHGFSRPVGVTRMLLFGFASAASRISCRCAIFAWPRHPHGWISQPPRQSAQRERFRSTLRREPRRLREDSDGASRQHARSFLGGLCSGGGAQGVLGPVPLAQPDPALQLPLRPQPALCLTQQPAGQRPSRDLGLAARLAARSRVGRALRGRRRLQHSAGGGAMGPEWAGYCSMLLLLFRKSPRKQVGVQQQVGWVLAMATQMTRMTSSLCAAGLRTGCAASSCGPLSLGPHTMPGRCPSAPGGARAQQHAPSGEGAVSVLTTASLMTRTVECGAAALGGRAGAGWVRSGEGGRSCAPLTEANRTQSLR